MKKNANRTNVFFAVSLLLNIVTPGVWANPGPVEILGETGQLLLTMEQSASGDGLRIVLADGSGEQRITCEDKTVTAGAAQGQQFSAMVEMRDCGATTDYATRVLLRGPAGTELVAVFAGKPDVKLTWTDQQTLNIDYASVAQERIYLQKNRTQAGFSITYRPVMPASIPTDQKKMDISNIHFGMTGTAAKMPREMLLRWAGWTQQQSGLYRKEWNDWTGASPYGDDPAEQKAILAGMQYADMKLKQGR